MMAREIRLLDMAHIEELIEWAADEGWNPGQADTAAFHAADPGGFLGCFVGGRMAAGLSAVRYGESFAFIGLYICHPMFRGQGHGRALWDHALAWLGNRTIGLDGVPEQQDNYARMGFKPAYRTWRWSGRFPALASPGPDIVPVTAEVAPQVAHLDARAFPGPRGAFLDRWLSPPRTALAIRIGDAVKGYGVLRRCRDGYKIGPLFAETDGEAEALLSALAARAGTEELHIDVPEDKAVFSAHLAGLGFTKGFGTARMYRGAPPEHDPNLVYGVTTLELG